MDGGEQKQTGVNIGRIAAVSFMVILLVSGGFFFSAVRSGVLSSEEVIVISMIWLVLLNEGKSTLHRVFGKHKPNEIKATEDIPSPKRGIQSPSNTSTIEILSIDGTELVFLMLFILTLFGGFISFPVLMSMQLSLGFMYTISGVWLVAVIGLMIGLISASHKKPINTKGQDEILSQLTGRELYIRAKRELTQNIENLEKVVKQDIENVGTNYKDIHTTALLIEGFGKSMSLATDALIDILPEDTSIISEFDNREEFYLYLDALLHEMDWIKKSSSEMQKQVQSWMVYHHIEVSQEKEKLEQLLKEGDNKLTESMETLLTLSRTLREESDGKKVEQILVRQKI